MAEPTATVDLAHLVRAYQVGVWRWLRFLGAMPAEADDLTQETFLAVWRRPFDQRDPDATRAYLRTVARNLYLKSLRKKGREPEQVDLASVDEDWARFAANDDGERWLLALRACLADATPRVRDALDLCYAEGRSRGEIGQRLGMSEDGVKSLLRRARETLRGCIERRIGA